MSWLSLAISYILFWGITDILHKKSADYSDTLSHFKGLIWIGVVMAIAGTITALFSKTFASSVSALKDNLYLIPVSILYPVALFFGLIGNRHLDASVISPLENIDGAIAGIILYLYFLFTGNNHITSSVGALNVIGTGLIILSIVALGIQEQKLHVEEKQIEESKKKHRLGALALLFPIVYNLVDALSMVATGITVAESTSNGISDIDFFIFECVGFTAVALVLWLYLIFAKKYVYNPFKREELSRCGAAVGETGGTMLFIFASAINPILTAPVSSAYCIVTIIFARVFLKEKLNKKQYISLTFLVLGIALLSIFEIIK